MAIKKRDRQSMLGSVEVSNLDVELQKENTSTSSTMENREEKYLAVESIIPTPKVEQQHATNFESEQRRQPVKVYQTPGRKRKELIPGDIDKTISIQLPTSLINKIQQYGRLHDQSMKEVIGYTLIEKFMK